MKKLIISLAILALTGCASKQYEQYAKAYETAAVAQANALKDIANSGSDAAKIVAIMTLSANTGQKSLAAPQNEALQWVSILVPSLTQIYGISKNADVAINSSNNSAAVANSTNNTFLGMASKIQAPAANVTTTLSGTGNLGSGSYSTTDNHTATTSPVVTPVVEIVPVVITPIVAP